MVRLRIKREMVQFRIRREMVQFIKKEKTMISKGRGILLFIILVCLSHLSINAEEMPLTPTSWAELQEAFEECEQEATITLEADIIAGANDHTLILPKGKSVILDLHGFTINRNLTELSKDDGSVLSVPEGSILTIRDSLPSTGKITGGYGSNGGGIINKGVVLLEGGSISGNKASEKGGGINNSRMLVIKGAAIIENAAEIAAGGIYNSYTGMCMLSETRIYGNEAPEAPDLLNIGSMTQTDENGVQGQTLTSIRSFIEKNSVVPILALTIGLFFFVGIDSYLSPYQKRAMYLVIAFIFSLIIQNIAVYHLGILPRVHPLRKIVDIYGYMVRPAILACFLRIVRPEKRHLAAWALVAVNALIYLTALFSPLTFSYTINNHFRSGPLGPTCLVISCCLFILLLYSTIQTFHPHKHKETWVPIAATGIILGSVFLDYNLVYDEQPLPFLTMGIAISCVFYYVWLHLQFVREHERALRADQQIQIMKTQIQPHFVFNTLSTIRSLCAKDPDTAIYAIEQFSICLRQNLESIDSSDLIPFAKELAHTRAYVEIEKLRFPNLQVFYSIEDERFELPALTIQPLVENAIRHGVRIRKEGIVRVMTHLDEEKKEHVIVIEDNGIGFDTTAKEAGKTDASHRMDFSRKEGAHIGLSNVKERLRTLCSGTMTIESEPDKGTRITLRIPLGEKTDK